MIRRVTAIQTLVLGAIFFLARFSRFDRSGLALRALGVFGLVENTERYS
jgi:hypothetical protein